MIGIGIGINYSRVFGSIDSQAQAHYDRVIADGGAVPSGLIGCSNWFVAVKAVYSTSDITTAISAGYDPHYLGYKLGAGSGITLGQAAQKLYSCCGASGDVTQTTAASQPLLLAHSGTNYYWGSGVSGNYCSTPNSVSNSISGDVEVVAKIDYVNNSSFQWICTKISTGSNISYSLSVDNTNSLRADFAASAVSSSVSIGSSYNGWVKLTRQSSSGDVKFFTSPDGITYTQLGVTRSTTAGSLTTGTGSLNIGSTTGSSFVFQGKIYRATISNSIGGSPVVDFNPNSYAASTSQTSWTSTTGEVWTINTGTATTGYKGVLVDRTIVQGDGVDDRMTTATNVIPATFTTYCSFNAYKETGGSGATVFGASSLNGALFQFSATQASGWYSGSVVQISASKSTKSLGLITLSGNGTSGSVKIQSNNGTETTGTGTSTAQIGSLMGNATYGQTNCIVNSILVSITDDTTPQRTAMYNAIRGFNNNAF